MKDLIKVSIAFSLKKLIGDSIYTIKYTVVDSYILLRFVGEELETRSTVLDG